MSTVCMECTCMAFPVNLLALDTMPGVWIFWFLIQFCQHAYIDQYLSISILVSCLKLFGRLCNRCELSCGNVAPLLVLVVVIDTIVLNGPLFTNLNWLWMLLIAGHLSVSNVPTLGLVCSNNFLICFWVHFMHGVFKGSSQVTTVLVIFVNNCYNIRLVHYMNGVFKKAWHNFLWMGLIVVKYQESLLVA